MPRAKLARWGDGLAVCLPADVAQAAGLDEGDQVDITPADGDLRIRRVRADSADALFASRSPEEWQRLYAKAYDWGDDLGRETVE